MTQEQGGRYFDDNPNLINPDTYLYDEILLGDEEDTEDVDDGGGAVSVTIHPSPRSSPSSGHGRGGGRGGRGGMSLQQALRGGGGIDSNANHKKTAAVGTGGATTSRDFPSPPGISKNKQQQQQHNKESPSSASDPRIIKRKTVKPGKTSRMLYVVIGMLLVYLAFWIVRMSRLMHQIEAAEEEKEERIETVRSERAVKQLLNKNKNEDEEDEDDTGNTDQRHHHQKRKHSDKEKEQEKEEDKDVDPEEIGGNHQRHHQRHHHHHQHKHKKDDTDTEKESKKEREEEGKAEDDSGGKDKHHHHHHQHHEHGDHHHHTHSKHNEAFYVEQEQNVTAMKEKTDDIVNNYIHSPKFNHKPVAFAFVVSNEDFIDGALALAMSFRQHSGLFNAGYAEIAVIVPEHTICEETLSRLHAVGMKIKSFPDLTKEAPEAHWAATFNKIYLFNLTEYARVAFFDVDMLMLRNPDEIFKTNLPPRHIGAMGNTIKPGRKPYFQTGMMLVEPNQTLFEEMLDDFRTNPEHKSVNGRDGVIIRKAFYDRYVHLPQQYSMHMFPEDPLNGVIGVHFRGDFKPWFNRETPPDKISVGAGKAKTDLEIGEAYARWWHTYEVLHTKYLAPLDQEKAKNDDTADIPSSYKPQEEMWLMRHTERSYVQPLTSVDVARHNMTVDGLKVKLGASGDSCDDTCSGMGDDMHCRDDALGFSDVVNSCLVLRRLLPEACAAPAVTLVPQGGGEKGGDEGGGVAETTKQLSSSSGMAVALDASSSMLIPTSREEGCGHFLPHSTMPMFNATSQQCAINPMNDKRRRPLCDAKADGVQRVCACVSSENIHAKAHSL